MRLQSPDVPDINDVRIKSIPIKNKLSYSQLKNHTKYFIQLDYTKTGFQTYRIWICNGCKKENDVKIIKENIDIMHSNGYENFRDILKKNLF